MTPPCSGYRHAAAQQVATGTVGMDGFAAEGGIAYLQSVGSHENIDVLVKSVFFQTHVDAISSSIRRREETRSRAERHAQAGPATRA